MATEQLPYMVAYPLEVAEKRLWKVGYQVKIEKTLPPGYKEPEKARYRVVRQHLNEGNVVELVVTLDLGKGGEMNGFPY